MWLIHLSYCEIQRAFPAPLVDRGENHTPIWWFGSNKWLHCSFPGWRGGPASESLISFYCLKYQINCTLLKDALSTICVCWDWCLWRIRGSVCLSTYLSLSLSPHTPSRTIQGFSICMVLRCGRSILHRECYSSCHAREHACKIAGLFQCQQKPQMDLPPLLNSSSFADSLPGEIPWA